MNYFFFAINIILSIFVFALPIIGLFEKINCDKYFSKWEMLAFSIGLGLPVATLFLYYLLVLIPLQSSLFYVLCIISMFLISLYFVRADLFTLFLALFNQYFSKKYRYFYAGGIFVLIMFYVFILSKKDFTEHDYLEYGVQGKIFYQSKVIEYSQNRYDANSHFYYVGLHGFTIPLVGTWERMLNCIYGINSDYLFRSVSPIYSILVIFILLVAFRKQSLLFRIMLLFGILFTYGFFIFFFKLQIDTIRIYFLLCSVILMLHAINRFSWKAIAFLGVFSGLHSNIHSLGVILTALQIVVLVTYLRNKSLAEKIKIILFLSTFALVFGGIHYFVDVFAGTGWIFKEIRYF